MTRFAHVQQIVQRIRAAALSVLAMVDVSRAQSTSVDHVVGECHQVSVRTRDIDCE
jgi:hypothetical protein